MDLIPGEHEPDPRTYDEALQDKDAVSWQRAMNSEIKSMYSNKGWELVKQPNDVKAVEGKWSYKRERGTDGKVETFKERLVAKGYT